MRYAIWLAATADNLTIFWARSKNVTYVIYQTWSACTWKMSPIMKTANLFKILMLGKPWRKQAMAIIFSRLSRRPCQRKKIMSSIQVKGPVIRETFVINLQRNIVALQVQKRCCNSNIVLINREWGPYGKISNRGIAILTSLSLGQYSKAEVWYFTVKNERSRLISRFLFISKINATGTNFSYRYLRLLQLCQNPDHCD